MVSKEIPVYLFVGQDAFSKDAKLHDIKQGFLSRDTESFNLDILHARELVLSELQEKLLCLPVKSKKRIVVVRDAQALSQDCRDFLIKYAGNPAPHIVLILDADRYEYKDEFLRHITRSAQVFRFKEDDRPDAFTLSRQIELRKVSFALKVLNRLLKNGEKPERILGGLRHSLLRAAASHLETRRRSKLLLACDLDIKRGRLKPAHALEKFVVNLCCFGRNLAR